MFLPLVAGTPPLPFVRQLNHNRLAVLIRMQPDTVRRLAIIIEDELAAIVGAVDWADGAIAEMAFAKKHSRAPYPSSHHCHLYRSAHMSGSIHAFAERIGSSLSAHSEVMKNSPMLSSSRCF
jgi:hypothetical protein